MEPSEEGGHSRFVCFESCGVAEENFPAHVERVCAAGGVEGARQLSVAQNGYAGDLGLAQGLRVCLERAPTITTVYLGGNRLSRTGIEQLVDVLVAPATPARIAKVSFAPRGNLSTHAGDPNTLVPKGELPKNAPPCLYRLLTSGGGGGARSGSPEGGGCTDASDSGIRELDLTDVPSAGLALCMLGKGVARAGAPPVSLTSLKLARTQLTAAQLMALAPLRLEVLMVGGGGGAAGAGGQGQTLLKGADIAAYLRAAPHLKKTLVYLDIAGVGVDESSYCEVFGALAALTPSCGRGGAAEGGAGAVGAESADRAGGKLTRLGLQACFSVEQIAGDAVEGGGSPPAGDESPAQAPLAAFVHALAALCGGLVSVDLRKCGFRQRTLNAFLDASDWTRWEVLKLDYNRIGAPGVWATPPPTKPGKSKGRAGRTSARERKQNGPDASSPPPAGSDAPDPAPSSPAPPPPLTGLRRLFAGTTRLQRLGLSGTKLKESDVEGLADALRRREEVVEAGAGPHPLTVLTFSSNYTASRRVLHDLRDMVCNSLPQLERLYLDGAGAATFRVGDAERNADGVDPIVDVLRHGAITTVTLSGNYIPMERLAAWFQEVDARGVPGGRDSESAGRRPPLRRFEARLLPSVDADRVFDGKKPKPRATTSAVLGAFLATSLAQHLQVLQLQHFVFEMRDLAGLAAWLRARPHVHLYLHYAYAGQRVRVGSASEQAALVADPLHYFRAWLPGVSAADATTRNLANLDLSNPECCDVVGWWLHVQTRAGPRDGAVEDTGGSGACRIANVDLSGCGVDARGLHLLLRGPFFAHTADAQLTRLDLSRNACGGDGLRALQGWLQRRAGGRLQHLDCVSVPWGHAAGLPLLPADGGAAAVASGYTSPLPAQPTAGASMGTALSSACASAGGGSAGGGLGDASKVTTLSLHGRSALAAFAWVDLSAADIFSKFPAAGGAVHDVPWLPADAEQALGAQFCLTLSTGDTSSDGVETLWSDVRTADMHDTTFGERWSSTGMTFRQQSEGPPSSATTGERTGGSGALPSTGAGARGDEGAKRGACLPPPAGNVTTTELKGHPGGVEIFIPHAEAPTDPSDTSAPAAYQVRCRKAHDKFLGRGSFGEVYKGSCLRSGIYFAVKCCRVSARSRGAMDSLMREAALMQSLTHPNVVRFFGCAHAGHGQFVIVMECLESSLTGVIKAEFPDPDERVHESFLRRCGGQILAGLGYLHGASVLHRDVKPSNILFDRRDGVCKLTDFGCSLFVDPDDDADAGASGTPMYMAPEAFAGAAGEVSFPVDLWAYGCTVLEFATRRPPFDLDALHVGGILALRRHLLKHDTRPAVPDDLSPPLREVLHACFRRAPGDRPTAAALLDFKFFGGLFS